MTSWNEKTSRLCIKVADWFSHPLAILLLPAACFAYIWTGGKVDNLTLLLSVLAISLTQMVLRAQNVDAEATKLQMAELVRAIPDARDEVAKEDLTIDDVHRLRKEIDDGVPKKL